MRPALPIIALTLIAITCSTSCGKTGPAPPPSSHPATGVIGSTSLVPLKEHPGKVRGRIVGADSGVAWKIGVMEFRATDPEVIMLTSGPVGPDLPGSAGRSFAVELPSVKFDVPYVVVAFRDNNSNGTIDQGEDFVGGRSEAPGYTGKNLFLFTAGGSFVGDRSWDLSEIEFVIDVSL